MPKSKKSWGIATNRCKKQGHKSFKKGSSGDKCRKKDAEKLGEL